MKMKKASTRKDKNSQFNDIKNRSWALEFKINWQLYLMLLIPFVYILVFKYYTMFGAQIAFRDYLPAKGIWKSDWVGLDHFVRFFNYPQWTQIVKNTLSISLYSLFFSLPFPLLLALAFEYARGKMYRKTVQMVTFLPHFLSTVIIVSLINLIFDNRIGNQSIRKSL